MKIVSMRRRAILALTLTTAFALTAQERNPESLSREMLLEKSYNPNVEQADRLYSLPNADTTKIDRSESEYATFVNPYEAERTIAHFDDGAVGTTLPRSAKQGYARLGFGYNWMLDGDLGYRFVLGKKRRDVLSLKYSNRSAWGTEDYLHTSHHPELMDSEGAQQRVADHVAQLSFSHRLDKAMLSFQGGYSHYNFNYYGQPTDYDISRYSDYDVATMQGNRLIEAGFDLKSIDTHDFTYDLKLQYYNFKRAFASSNAVEGIGENHFNAIFEMHKQLDHHSYLGFDAHVDFLCYEIPELAPKHEFVNYADYLSIEINPFYLLHGDDWSLRAGALTHFNVGISGFIISPDIDIKWWAVPEAQIYFSARGTGHNHTNFDMYRLNRYITPTERINHSHEWINTHLGVKSELSPFSLLLGLEWGYSFTADDMYFYSAPEGLWGNVAKPLEMDTHHLWVKANGKWGISDGLTFKGDATYHHYATDMIVHPHHAEVEGGKTCAFGRPSFEMNLAFRYEPIEHLTLELSYLGMYGRKAALLEEHFAHSTSASSESHHNTFHTVDMAPINELSLRAEYLFNDTFTFFARANNLLNAKYEYFYGYREYGLNLMVGTNIRF